MPVITGVAMIYIYDDMFYFFYNHSFNVVMRHKPLFYIMNIIFPAVLLHILATMTFLLPASTGERTGYSLTTLLTFTVFTLLIAESIPESSNAVPLLCKLYFVPLITV